MAVLLLESVRAVRVYGCMDTDPTRPDEAKTTAAAEPAGLKFGEELLPTRPSLLARLRNRDDSRSWNRGWEEFFKLYHPLIFRYALNWGLSERDAEDVVQEVVIGVATGLPQFQYDPRRGKFKTWLFRVARNKVVDHLRRKTRRETVVLPQAGGFAVDGSPEVEVADEQTVAPDQEFELAWARNLMRAALEHVKERAKPMTVRLYLHQMEGHSVQETVRYFRDSQVTPDAVYLAKHRIQKMLDETVRRLSEGELLG